MRQALFVDRDGTIIHDPGYLSRVEQISFFPDVLKKLALIKKQGLLLFIITNQSGIGRGYFTEDQLREIHEALCAMMIDAGVSVDAIKYCPHAPAENCPHRKPSPNMVLDLAAKFDVDLKKSFFVGDKLSDVQTGKNAGCKTVLITHGKELIDLIETNKFWVEADINTDTPEQAFQWVLDQVSVDDKKETAL
ncbi:MAG: HAD family hydrolase [Candidatus Auribacterota bacterium]|jgi:D-glycero-D-manno-heptose 1,7-bisphosphate phosphatase|nr:HAD family hydrolase [Candidatus Auribacterota bacterium]